MTQFQVCTVPITLMLPLTEPLRRSICVAAAKCCGEKLDCIDLYVH